MINEILVIFINVKKIFSFNKKYKILKILTQHVTSNSSGYFFPLTLATVFKSFAASLFLPLVSNQLADSGMNLQVKCTFLRNKTLGR